MTFSARGLAVFILTEVEQSGAHAEVLLDRLLETHSILDEREKRLLTELTYGTLRMKGLCDFVLKSHLQQWQKLEMAVKNILRLSVYQILYTDRIPPFAIVNEAVNLTKSWAPKRAGLVNAVLRRILAKKRDELLPAPASRSIRLVSALYSHPVWLMSHWIKRWGREETINLCLANNRLPPVCLRINTLKITKEEAKENLLREGFAVSEARLSPDGLIISGPSGQLRKSPIFREGGALYQDEASQLISYLVSPAPGETVLDLCAGAGGKTFHLAALMKNQGRILALDMDEEKLHRLSREAPKFGVSIVETKPLDLIDSPPEDLREHFDRVLVDAPCSGTGTLRRAPEIKWRLRPEDLSNFRRIQLKILDFAAHCIRKGGTLTYSTCSVMEEENERVVFAFLERHRHFRLLPPSSALPEKVIDERGFLRTYPHRHGTDGFFGAVMVKI